MAYHARSTSAPSTPRSNGTAAEERLQSLKAAISSPSGIIDTACHGLVRLAEVHEWIEKAVWLPSNQASLRHPQQRQALEGELDRSLAMLDLCNAVQDNLDGLKTNLQELRLVLKRADQLAFQLKIVQSCARLMNKAHKHAKKIGKQACSDHKGRSLVVRLVAEARETTGLLLESALQLVSKQMAMPCSSSRWSLVSKTLQKRKPVWNEEQLLALEMDISELESGVKALFRKMIQNRVSLLNALSS